MAQNKKSPTNTKPRSKKNVKQEEIHNYNHFYLTAFFAGGLLCLALILIKGNNVWRFFHDIFFGLFGVFAIFVPIVMLVTAGIIAFGKQGKFFKLRLISAIVGIFLACSLLQTLTPAGYGNTHFFRLVERLYIDGTQLHGGGVASIFIGYWLELLTGGAVPSIIIMSLILFLIIVLITGITLSQILTAMGKPITFGISAYKNAKKNKAERPRPVVSEEFPEHPVSSIKQEQDIISMLSQATENASKKPQKSTNASDFASTLANAFAPEPSTKELVSHENASRQPIDHLIDKVVVEQNEKSPPFDPKTGEIIKPTTPANETEQTISDISSDLEKSKLYVDGDNQTLEYRFPPVSLLTQHIPKSNDDVSRELKANATLLVDTLKSFGVSTKIVNISRGPTVTQYELQPSAGVKISKITGLADDIALNLASSGVRIEAPIPNKAAIGIEVPNKVTDIVSAREIIDSDEFRNSKSNLTVAMGKNISGQTIVADLAKMPHTLIAGSTGSGKSVCINSLISSLIYKSSPSEVRLILIDPKVVELGIYNGIPHLLVPVVTDPKKASGALAWAVQEMLKRYNTFAENSVRDIRGYNEVAMTKEELNPMPQIVIIIDELADLMMAAPNEVEDSICRLAQMARAAGMHLVIATQRPSVDVITGVIKANIPSRIAFAVSSQIDSRTILDGAGAEKLLGRGDMLFYPSGMSKPLRVQGCWISDKEVEDVVKFVSGQSTGSDYDQHIIEEIEKNAAQTTSGDSKDSNNTPSGYDDELFPVAVECILDAGQASTSYLQRKIKVGYARAARLIDELEDKGIIGGFDGSKPRQLLITRSQWLAMSNPNGNYVDTTGATNTGTSSETPSVEVNDSDLTN